MSDRAEQEAHRRVALGMIGGGLDSIIGQTHLIASQLDGLCRVVAGAMSIDPDIAAKSARAAFIAEERSYASGLDPAACEPDGARRCARFVVLVTGRRAMAAVAETLRLRRVHRRAIGAGGTPHCFFMPSVGAGPRISRALVFVDKTLALPMLNTCLHEEIYQSFGLFGDYSGSRHFSFDDVVAPKHLTRFDRALLATLYREESPSAAGVAARLVDALGEPSADGPRVSGRSP